MYPYPRPPSPAEELPLKPHDSGGPEGQCRPTMETPHDGPRDLRTPTPWLRRYLHIVAHSSCGGNEGLLTSRESGSHPFPLDSWCRSGPSLGAQPLLVIPYTFLLGIMGHRVRCTRQMHPCDRVQQMTSPREALKEDRKGNLAGILGQMLPEIHLPGTSGCDLVCLSTWWL